MISLVTGTLRSGKTLYTVGRIVDHLAKGGILYTNIDLEPEIIAKVIRKRFRRIMQPDQIRFVDLAGDKSWHQRIDVWGVPGEHILACFDEIHLFFNARDWMKTQALHADMLSFISQSGKAGIDIIFIAQVASTLEAQFRKQCEWEFICRNMRDVRIPILGTLPINRMLLIQKHNQSEAVVDRGLVRYDRGLFGCYKTLSFLDTQMREAEKNTPRVGFRKLKRAPLISKQGLASLLVTLLGALIYWKIHK